MSVCRTLVDFLDYRTKIEQILIFKEAFFEYHRIDFAISVKTPSGQIFQLIINLVSKIVPVSQFIPTDLLTFLDFLFTSNCWLSLVCEFSIVEYASSMKTNYCIFNFNSQYNVIICSQILCIVFIKVLKSGTFRTGPFDLLVSIYFEDQKQFLLLQNTVERANRTGSTSVSFKFEGPIVNCPQVLARFWRLNCFGD